MLNVKNLNPTEAYSRWLRHIPISSEWSLVYGTCCSCPYCHWFSSHSTWTEVARVIISGDHLASRQDKLVGNNGEEINVCRHEAGLLKSVWRKNMLLPPTTFTMKTEGKRHFKVPGPSETVWKITQGINHKNQLMFFQLVQQIIAMQFFLVYNDFSQFAS